MMKTITTILYIIFIIFLAWLAVSWVEIVLKNVNEIEISSWNLFQLFPKIF